MLTLTALWLNKETQSRFSALKRTYFTYQSWNTSCSVGGSPKLCSHLCHNQKPQCSAASVTQCTPTTTDIPHWLIMGLMGSATGPAVLTGKIVLRVVLSFSSKTMVSAKEDPSMQMWTKCKLDLPKTRSKFIKHIIQINILYQLGVRFWYYCSLWFALILSRSILLLHFVMKDFYSNTLCCRFGFFVWAAINVVCTGIDIGGGRGGGREGRGKDSLERFFFLCQISVLFPCLVQFLYIVFVKKDF